MITLALGMFLVWNHWTGVLSGRLLWSQSTGVQEVCVQTQVGLDLSCNGNRSLCTDRCADYCGRSRLSWRNERFFFVIVSALIATEWNKKSGQTFNVVKSQLLLKITHVIGIDVIMTLCTKIVTNRKDAYIFLFLLSGGFYQYKIIAPEDKNDFLCSITNKQNTVWPVTLVFHYFSLSIAKFLCQITTRTLKQFSWFHTITLHATNKLWSIKNS